MKSQLPQYSLLAVMRGSAFGIKQSTMVVRVVIPKFHHVSWGTVDCALEKVITRELPEDPLDDTDFLGNFTSRDAHLAVDAMQYAGLGVFDGCCLLRKRKLDNDTIMFSVAMPYAMNVVKECF